MHVSERGNDLVNILVSHENTGGGKKVVLSNI